MYLFLKICDLCKVTDLPLRNVYRKPTITSATWKQTQGIYFREKQWQTHAVQNHPLLFYDTPVSFLCPHLTPCLLDKNPCNKSALFHLRVRVHFTHQNTQRYIYWNNHHTQITSPVALSQYGLSSPNRTTGQRSAQKTLINNFIICCETTDNVHISYCLE